MRRRGLVLIASALTFVALTGDLAVGATVWTDRNGDGLPDSGVSSIAVGTEFTVDVWIDSETFTWTNYLVYIEHASGAFKRRDANYWVQGANFPVDRFSHPRGFGFGGYGYNTSGTTKIGWATFKFLGSISSKCISPIIDVNNSYGVFCQLGSGESYALFSTGSTSCYKTQAGGGGAKVGDDGTIAAEEGSSWGRVKGLFR